MSESFVHFLNALHREKENGAFCGDVHLKESMKNLCTFRIGGEAGCVVYPENAVSFMHTVSLCDFYALPHRIIGAGSNVLFPDESYNGVLIVTRHMQQIEITGEKIKAECGTMLSSLILACGQAGIGGMEMLFGIPGTVGGALRMNAGAFGAQISDFVESVVLYDVKTKAVFTLPKEKMRFSYRTSLLNSARYVALRATFQLKRNNPCACKAAVKESVNKRIASQPHDFPNAGSVFKRPRQDCEVWKLIDGCGMRGKRIGGAEISKKHAGFIVNADNATAKDVKALIAEIKNAVYKKYAIPLETEIEMIDG